MVYSEQMMPVPKCRDTRSIFKLNLASVFPSKNQSSILNNNSANQNRAQGYDKKFSGSCSGFKIS
jgi:hypothetical protein